MSGIVLFLLWCWNTFVCWGNTRVLGRSWADSKAIGGWPRFLACSTWAVTAAGFTWCWMVPIGVLAHASEIMSAYYCELFLKTTYVFVVLPMVFGGIAIWLDSVTTAWRQRDLASTANAAYNTWAQCHNTFNAIQTVPEFVGDIFNAFTTDKDDENGSLGMVVLLVALSLGAGILTTIYLVNKYAADYSREVFGSDS